jgi:hypothetical protein
MVDTKERSFTRLRGLRMTMNFTIVKKDGSLKAAATKSRPGRSVA